MGSLKVEENKLMSSICTKFRSHPTFILLKNENKQKKYIYFLNPDKMKNKKS